ncbi:hypothetical protein J715_0438 [Acinetobacter baumannii 1571545]|nr:hypothetical protein J525_0996 [Acinetobacter sp. 21871]EXR62968.1 hypothetical protein J678_2032 [Acinetobacter sp. 1424608]KCY50977.1 hypothetical protein J715_0438 [Acinetobacter baumannii 1571545]
MCQKTYRKMTSSIRLKQNSGIKKKTEGQDTSINDLALDNPFSE